MLVDIADHHQAFNRAHKALIDKHGQPRPNDHWHILEDWWLEEYGAEIVRYGAGHWKELFFKTESEATMFLLKWA